MKLLVFIVVALLSLGGAAENSTVTDAHNAAATTAGLPITTQGNLTTESINVTATDQGNLTTGTVVNSTVTEPNVGAAGNSTVTDEHNAAATTAGLPITTGPPATKPNCVDTSSTTPVTCHNESHTNYTGSNPANSIYHVYFRLWHPGHCVCPFGINATAVVMFDGTNMTSYEHVRLRVNGTEVCSNESDSSDCVGLGRATDGKICVWNEDALNETCATRVTWCDNKTVSLEVGHTHEHVCVCHGAPISDHSVVVLNNTELSADVLLGHNVTEYDNVTCVENNTKTTTERVRIIGGAAVLSVYPSYCVRSYKCWLNGTLYKTVTYKERGNESPCHSNRKDSKPTDSGMAAMLAGMTVTCLMLLLILVLIWVRLYFPTLSYQRLPRDYVVYETDVSDYEETRF